MPGRTSVALTAFVNNVGGKQAGPGSQQQGLHNSRWNPLGFLIYDGPVRNQSRPLCQFKMDITGFLTKDDQSFLASFSQYPTARQNTKATRRSDGQFETRAPTPPPPWEREFVFTNTDLRHQVFTEKVNLAPFNDGDKNTAILDEDGSLSGLQSTETRMVSLSRPVLASFQLSLNNLEFNRASNSGQRMPRAGTAGHRRRGPPHFRDVAGKYGVARNRVGNRWTGTPTGRCCSIHACGEKSNVQERLVGLRRSPGDDARHRTR